MVCPHHQEDTVQLTFLVDNNTLIDRYFLAEPGLSVFIEDGDSTGLFDVGYSDVFLTNARRKGIDLRALDWIALSHGHLDHTWGLDALIRHFLESALQARPALVAHPEVFRSRYAHDANEIGMLLDEERLARHFEPHLTAEPCRLTDDLLLLGEIPRTTSFEPPVAVGEYDTPDGPEPDFIPDDTALVYTGGDGLVVISGCAHSGICNTVEQARNVTGVRDVRAVLGGFHLQNAPQERLQQTVDYLGSLDLDALYACHCTDLAAKTALASTCPLKEVGAGLSLAF